MTESSVFNDTMRSGEGFVGESNEVMKENGVKEWKHKGYSPRSDLRAAAISVHISSSLQYGQCRNY